MTPYAEGVKVYEETALVQEIQNLINRTKSTIITRDRRGASSTTDLKIESVQRIENVDLWQSYCFKRARLSRKGKENGFRLLDDIKTQGTWDGPPLEIHANEIFLFHGTSIQAVQNIIHRGFSDKLGRDSGLFGAGIYFAESATKSDEYARPINSEGDHFYLFLSRVSMGSVHHTHTHLNGWREAPCRQGCRQMCRNPMHQKHDSVMGHAAYRELVVYNSDQTYPEFLIKYSRR